MSADTSGLHPLLMLDNRLERLMSVTEPALGLFLVTGNPLLAEACAFIGVDWVTIDMEAAPIGRAEVLQQLQALAASQLLSLIRVATLDRHLIEHALDVGADGIIVPKVESAGEAARAVEACRFPPEGRRGVNPVRASAYFSNLPEYFARANHRTVCGVQIETRAGVAQAKEIAATPGVDLVFIGAGDLASDLGQPGDPTGPLFDEARAKVLDATLTAARVPGIFAYGVDLAQQYAAEGFRFIGVGNEVKIFTTGALELIGRCRA